MSQLTPAQKQSLGTYINQKWKSGCACCGAKNFISPDQAYQLMGFDPSVGLNIGGPIVPVLPITCANCGNTILLNAIIAGVLPPAPAAPTSTSKS
jgi:hypothetical protein